MAMDKEIEAAMNAACGVELNDGRALEQAAPADECERIVRAALSAAEQARATDIVRRLPSVGKIEELIDHIDRMGLGPADFHRRLAQEIMAAFPSAGQVRPASIRDAIIQAKCASPDGTFVHASTDDVVRAIASAEHEGSVDRDAAIESAAKKIYEVKGDRLGKEYIGWDKEPDEVKDDWRVDVRATIDAYEAARQS